MLITGSILLMLGAAAIRSDQPGFNLILVGLAIFFFGFIFWNRWRSKKRRSTRFSKFRKNPEKDKQKDPERDFGWEDSFDE